jgi:hypothetical protein
VPICHLKTMESVPEEDFVVGIHRHSGHLWELGGGHEPNIQVRAISGGGAISLSFIEWSFDLHRTPRCGAILRQSGIRMEIAPCGLLRLVSICPNSEQSKKACPPGKTRQRSPHPHVRCRTFPPEAPMAPPSEKEVERSQSVRRTAFQGSQNPSALAKAQDPIEHSNPGKARLRPRLQFHSTSRQTQSYVQRA